MTPAVRAALFVAGISACAALPVAGRAMRKGGGPRCALDGVAVPKATRVEIQEAATTREFCCVDCARAWLARASGAPSRVTVTDETSGEPTPAAEAFYVRSRIVAFDVTGCRIHVFAHEADAKAHMAQYGGFLLSGAERPLGRE